MAGRSTKSESPVAAREQLDERTQPEGSNESLQQDAKSQERQQREELAAGKPSGAHAKASRELSKLAQEAPAGARAGVHRNAATRGGFMDQLSTRSHDDALEGHPVTIDLNDGDVKEEYGRVFSEDRFPNGHRGDYGIYLQPLLRDPETGIPVTAQVRLRDDTHAIVSVPYAALTRAANGGRR